MRKLLLALAFPLYVFAATPEPAPCRLSDATINATLWMQTSAEYKAITREIYAAATRTLDEAIADKTWSAATEQTKLEATMPPAVILDLDETVLDTSGHQTLVIRNAGGFSEDDWHEWAMHDASNVIAAAKDFLLAAQKKGVAIFYVTNRIKTEEEPLRATLTRLGLPLTNDNLLVRGARDEWNSSDKTPRRAFVASKYRVIMLFGDDLNDFAPANGTTLAERDAIVAAHANDWGRKWYAIPNPMYGSWENTIIGGAKGCDQLKKKVDGLR